MRENCLTAFCPPEEVQKKNSAKRRRKDERKQELVILAILAIQQAKHEGFSQRRSLKVPRR